MCPQFQLLSRFACDYYIERMRSEDEFLETVDRGIAASDRLAAQQPQVVEVPEGHAEECEEGEEEGGEEEGEEEGGEEASSLAGGLLEDVEEGEPASSDNNEEGQALALTPGRRERRERAVKVRRIRDDALW